MFSALSRAEMHEMATGHSIERDPTPPRHHSTRNQIVKQTRRVRSTQHSHAVGLLPKLRDKKAHLVAANIVE